MPSPRDLFALSLAFVALHAKHLTIPLTQHWNEDEANLQDTHAVAKYAGSTSNSAFATAPVAFAPRGFWYASFDVGDSKNLSLIVDTGSQAVVLNPELYRQSPESIDLKIRNRFEYGTAQANGCGTLSLAYDGYEDAVTFSGLISKHQRLAAGRRSQPRNDGVITQLPHRK